MLSIKYNVQVQVDEEQVLPVLSMSLHQLAQGLIWNQQHREEDNMRPNVINCDVFIAGDDHEDVAFVMQRLFSNEADLIPG